MARLVRPVERRVIEIEAAKRRKAKCSNYAELNRLLPLSDEAKEERAKAQNLLIAMFQLKSPDAEREERGMMNLAAALGLELKPRTPRVRW